MNKKWIEKIYLPTPIVVSLGLFIASLIFSFCYCNPAWATSVGTETMAAEIAFGSSFAFIFAIWLIADLFLYYEKDIKIKARQWLLFSVGICEILTVVMGYLYFGIYQRNNVVNWLLPITFLYLLAFTGFGLYLRIREWKYSGREKVKNEDFTFIYLMASTATFSFMPLWNANVLGSDVAGNYGMWMFLCLLYFLGSLALLGVAIFFEFKSPNPIKRNEARLSISIAAIVIGVFGILLTALLFDSGSAYPTEACYYMIANGIGFLFFGLLGLFYEEVRKNNPRPLD